MKIHVDLIHPANLHYFKHFIKEMIDRGNTVVISARNKDVMFQLIQSEGFEYVDFGSGSIGKGALGKLLYLISATFKMLIFYFKNRPDISLSFGSLPTAVCSSIFRNPHISFDDTEHAQLNRKLITPFVTLFCTPRSFQFNLGKKHLRINSNMEMFYLNQFRFKPDKQIVNSVGINTEDKYVFVRFVSWGAFHDIGINRISDEQKIQLINELSKLTKVYISSEGDVPSQLSNYLINIPPDKIHHVLNYSSVYVGEGGTMASESAMLGVPAVYINSLPLMGYLQEAEKEGLLFHLQTYDDIKQKAVELLEQDKNHFTEKRDKMVENFIEPTKLLIWLIDEFPQSMNAILKDSNIQNKFLIK
jgi:predicted glycosyltransferase